MSVAILQQACVAVRAACRMDCALCALNAHINNYITESFSCIVNFPNYREKLELDFLESARIAKSFFGGIPCSALNP